MAATASRLLHVAASREPWILDIDTTVKPLYGHQEGAVVGYNPRSQGGRAIAIIHTRWLAHGWYSMSMLLPATSTRPNISAPGLWALLDRIPRDLWPALLRGDCRFGNEPIMREAEQRGLAYLFKLRLTANVKRMIERLATQGVDERRARLASKEGLLRLDGWSRQRRVIILRRRVEGALTMSSSGRWASKRWSFVEVGADATSGNIPFSPLRSSEELVSFGQLYRDRGDGENIFDELKNQWGWGWLRNAATLLVPARPHASSRCFRLVEHLRSSGRAGPAYGGYHQSAIALAGHCHAGAACETNNDDCGEFTRPGEFPPRRRSAPSPSFYANSQKLRSS